MLVSFEVMAILSSVAAAVFLDLPWELIAFLFGSWELAVILFVCSLQWFVVNRVILSCSDFVGWRVCSVMDIG